MSHATTEHAMTRVALRAGLVVGPFVVAAAWALRGNAGAVTAAGGIALVLVWFAAIGLSLAWAAPRGPATFAAAALGGYALRVVTLGLLAVTLSPLGVVDGPVLVATVAAGTVALLVFEVRFVSRRADLWWLTNTPGKEGA